MHDFASLPLLRSFRVALALTVGLTAAPALAQFQFADVSSPAAFEPPFSANIPAGGIAVADFNRNGYPDIFVTGYNFPNRLFFNNGDGTFSENAAINDDLAGLQCSVTAAADYDNDGWPDLYVGCRTGPNFLFRNLEGNGFADVTPPELNHDPSSSSAQRTDAVAWGDLTGNGYPDLFIGIYPTAAFPDPGNPDNLDRIVLNHGDGSWTDVAVNLDPAVLSRTALAAVFTDIDGDGDVDLYVVNDKLQGNVLWRNDGPGCGGWCLTDVSVSSGTHRPVFGMGIAIGDIDRDGLPDLFFSSIGEQVLLRGVSNSPLEFEEWQDVADLDHDQVGWATILADFDRDGHEDAYLAVAASPAPGASGADQCYSNLGDGTFTNVTATSGLDADRPTQAAAIIDFDRDGRLDLVLGHWNDGYRLYRNQSQDPYNWIGFRLEGGAPGVTRDALGARVEVETADGVQWRELRAGESRGSSHDRILHFGLGTHEQAEVTILWPDGQVETVGALPAGRYHHRAHPAVDLLFEDRFD